MVPLSGVYGYLMAIRDADETAGDVALAMQLVTDLVTDPEATDPAGRMQATVDRADSVELVRGLGTVLTACIELLDDPGQAVMPVVTQLRARGLVTAQLLPTMGGALTAAAVAQPPAQWRQGLGHISSTEIPAWAYTAWLLAELTEHSLGAGTVTALAHRLGA